MITVTAQGGLLELQHRQNVPPAQTTGSGGKRGRITEFSAASRRRVMKLFARLDPTGVRATFLTLTFSECPSHAEAYAALRRFIERIRRRVHISAVWRKELQERGSIHYHIILFGFPYVPQRRIQAIWQECTGEATSIVHIKLIRNIRHLMSYVSKYMAKVNEENSASLDNDAYLHAEDEWTTGRWWGYINRQDLPYGELLQITVPDGDPVRYLAWSMNWLSNFRCARDTMTKFLFTDECYKIVHVLSKMVYAEAVVKLA